MFEKRIYVFRCEETGLYAFAADREGRMLPSQLYPQITWRFEQALTLGFDGNSSRDQILRATLDGVAKRGFHLIHPALYRTAGFHYARARRTFEGIKAELRDHHCRRDVDRGGAALGEPTVVKRLTALRE